ncbi:GTPase IMAP family member 8-like [Megalobrama amblycephala]|uniref:GTPase IMAP family member 8-like n=1 Tax=Megalobrama amblycephala TaxID=75352 RepID=UPI002013E5A4|nr:GTPase IMAP family member 8-like [Megalobrama amblycephala]XP_048028484.1 GTPase IMAP family member 8-like [Megalobrama amblycephala]
MSKHQGNKQMDLRAVLLGRHHSGKTSVINTILETSETEAKGSADNVKREGFIDGRRVSLVETPGWWKTFSLSDLSNISKQQLVRRMSLTSPGPHAVMIVIRADCTFTDTDRKFLEEYVELLGPNVWTHALVILTRGDLVKQEHIEQNIQESGSALMRLVEKCENRCHVFNNLNHHDRTQVTELLKKIEGIVGKNNVKHYDIDLEKVKEVNEEWEEILTRASSRKSRVQKQRSIVQEKAYVRRLEEIRVVLLGWILSGKSSAGNTILNTDEFDIGGRTGKAKRCFRDVEGRKMTVLDTPGWWKYFTSELNPDFIRSAILENVSECKKFPHAMLLVIPADTSFQEEQKRIVEENMSILGEDVWRHTIVLFTWGDRFKDVSIEKHIESEGDALQWLIEKCRNRYHVFDNSDKKNRAQVTELLQKIDEMVTENSLFRFKSQKNSDPEKSLQRADKHEDRMIEIKLKDVCHFLDEGFKRKAEEIREKIENVIKDIMEGSLNDSMNFLLEFQDEPLNSKKEVNIPSQQENFPEPIKSLLEREFSRWESIIIEGVQESLLDIKSSFELSQAEKLQMTKDSVEKWLQNCCHYVEHTSSRIRDLDTEDTMITR